MGLGSLHGVGVTLVEIAVGVITWGGSTWVYVAYMGLGLRWLRVQGEGLRGVGVCWFVVAYMGLGLLGLRFQGWRLHWVKKHGFGVHRNEKTLCWDTSGEGILSSSS